MAGSDPQLGSCRRTGDRPRYWWRHGPSAQPGAAGQMVLLRSSEQTATKTQETLMFELHGRTRADRWEPTPIAGIDLCGMAYPTAPKEHRSGCRRRGTRGRRSSESGALATPTIHRRQPVGPVGRRWPRVCVGLTRGLGTSWPRDSKVA